MTKPILVIDNYDSFVYNLVHYLADISGVEPVVARNDRITVADASEFDNIVLSPGPGIPSEAGNMPLILQQLAPTKRILGVCLGHQAIGECFGGSLHNMSEVCHGKGLETLVVDEQAQLFRKVPKTFKSARYHSWVVNSLDLPAQLRVTASDAQGRIMAVQHTEFDVHGVQFHPESVLTEHGHLMLKNWLAM